MRQLATYYLPSSNFTRQVQVTLEQNKLVLLCSHSAELICTVELGTISVPARLGNLPCEISLPDGDLLKIPADAAIINELLPRATLLDRAVNNLEHHKLFWILAMLLVPISFYWLVNFAIPSMASSVASQVPQSVKGKLDQQLMPIYDEVLLASTELSDDQQQRIKQHWQQVLTALNLSAQQYQLLFRKSEEFGANAFALPGGTVVITDELVNLFPQNPNAITAILLHEIGHVKFNHSMNIVGESIGTTLLITYFLGDLNGLAELFSGTALTLVQNNYSRNLESQADDFAIKQLQVLGQSPQAFVDAMTALSEQAGKYDHLLKYFSSHPEIHQRIEKAQQAIH